MPDSLEDSFNLAPLDTAIASHPRRAAVAVVLRRSPMGPEVLLMKRAEFPGDRWSGHVSFPGGSEEPVDPDMFATAIRETREEVGLDLPTQARALGRLNTTNTRARSPIRPLMIVPFVFELQRPAKLRLNAEAVEGFWLPLRPAFAGTFDETYHYPFGPVRMKFPCWHYEGKIVWGLTYNMLQDLRGRKT